MSLCGDVDAAGIRMPLHRFAGTIRRNKHHDDRAHGRLQNPLAQNDVRAGEPSRRWEARWNKWKGQVIYDILFKAASQTLITIAADPKHLGARIGMTAVLHTWGSALTHHPHVHIIVPGGGISLACPGQRSGGTQWVSCRPGFFLPVRVLSRLFRRLFLEKLAAAHKDRRLAFFNDLAPLADRDVFDAHIAPLRKTEWVVYAKRPPGQARGRLRTRGRARLSLTLYPSHRHRQQPAHRLRWRQCDLQMEGLPNQRTRAIQDHDAWCPRVHPTIPYPRPAIGLPPYPPWSLPRA